MLGYRPTQLPVRALIRFPCTGVVLVQEPSHLQLRGRLSIPRREVKASGGLTFCGAGFPGLQPLMVREEGRRSGPLKEDKRVTAVCDTSRTSQADFYSPLQDKIGRTVLPRDSLDQALRRQGWEHLREPITGCIEQTAEFGLSALAASGHDQHVDVEELAEAMRSAFRHYHFDQ